VPQKEVRVHLAADLVQVARDQGGTGRDAGVVDEDGHIPRGRRRRDDGLVVEDVESQRHHPGVVEVEALGAPARRVDLARPALEQFEHELTADTAVGSGDEGDLVGGGDVHGFLAFRVGLSGSASRVRPGIGYPKTSRWRQGQVEDREAGVRGGRRCG